jgi:signal transduction histidine kinase
VVIFGAPGDGLSVEVRNPIRVGAEPARPVGSGYGLVGLAERAALARGRFEHGRTPGRDFVVRAWLPWPE